MAWALADSVATAPFALTATARRNQGLQYEAEERIPKRLRSTVKGSRGPHFTQTTLQPTPPSPGSASATRST
jgi:hypothetical protein